MSESSAKSEHYFFLALLIIAGYIMFLICRPFLAPLILAISCAIVFHPVNERIRKQLGGSKNTAAFVTVLLVLVLILVPLVFLGGLLFNEARNLYVSIATQSGGFAKVVADIQAKLQTISPNINFNVSEYLQNSLQWMLSNLNTFFSSFVKIILGAVVMIIALFFLLRDGKVFRDRLFLLSPLKHEYDEGIFTKLTMTINSVIKGSLVIGVIQGLFATVGFVITGVPNPLIWGVAVVFASFIPGVGTSIVTVPSIIFLFFTAPLWHGIVLVVWAVCAIGLIDNFLTPIILKRGLKIHQFFILISVLGGVAYFGPIGFIMGPVMLAFFFALLDIYPLITANHPT